MNSPIRVSAVVPTYNRREILAKTLPTLFAQTFLMEEYEIVVVVDGSTDGTLEWLHSLRPPMPMCILSQANRGLAAAKNAGISAAQGEVVLFVDDDILCDSGLIQAHAKAHERVGPAAYFGPVFLTPESRPGLASDLTGCF